MAGFFITATNTDRGKTLFTTAMRLWLQKQGHNCLAMKPVQTGMQQRKLSPDLHSIYTANAPNSQEEEPIYQQLKPLWPLLQPYCYRQACSPHLAAERDGRCPVDLDHVQDCAVQLTKYCDILLVEGAGGFYVPLNRKTHLTVADMAQKLNWPVILVAQSGLGAINDTCLSLMAIQKWKLPIVGFVLNDLAPNRPPEYIRQDNPQIITTLSGIPCLGILPYIANRQSPKELIQGFESLNGLGLLQKFIHSAI